MARSKAFDGRRRYLLWRFSKRWGFLESDFNQYIPVFNLQGVNRDFCTGTVSGFTRRGIPSPGVPRAHDLAVLDRSLAERPAAMQADIVHRAVSPVYVGDANFPVAARELFGFIRPGKIGFDRYLGEVRHCLCSSWRPSIARPDSRGGYRYMSSSLTLVAGSGRSRSEERRVGKEGRSSG